MGNGCPQQQTYAKEPGTVGGIAAPAFAWRGKSFCCDGALRKQEEDERGGEEDSRCKKKMEEEGKMRKQGESND
jgi:hypothetical protein